MAARDAVGLRCGGLCPVAPGCRLRAEWNPLGRSTLLIHSISRSGLDGRVGFGPGQVQRPFQPQVPREDGIGMSTHCNHPHRAVLSCPIGAEQGASAFALRAGHDRVEQHQHFAVEEDLLAAPLPVGRGDGLDRVGEDVKSRPLELPLDVVEVAPDDGARRPGARRSLRSVMRRRTPASRRHSNPVPAWRPGSPRREHLDRLGELEETRPQGRPGSVTFAGSVMTRSSKANSG